MPAARRWFHVAVGFLVVTYSIGSPLTAYIEFQDQVLSQRFALPSWLIYLTCAIQIVCAAGILYRPTRVAAAIGFTVITLGAIVSHLRIGSPQTALPALFYTAVQVWVAFRVRNAARQASSSN